MNAEPIRLLLVDDHPVVLDGLEAMFSVQPDFQVVARATGPEQAIAALQEHRPDVAILDLGMPEMDGVELLARLLELQPELRILVFTALDSENRILDAVRAGAHGYLLKGVPRQELFQAVRILHLGGSLLQPVVASRLLDGVRQEAQEPGPGMEPLSTREQEVLQLLAKGLQNKEIAVQLTISERTVKFHVSSILRKLEVENRTEAVTSAVRHGLVDLEQL